MSSSGRNRFPFTAAQWQELEHQALIFKYMVSGIPIPPDLLFSVKRSCSSTSTCLDSPFTSTLFPHQPQHMGWNYLQMGPGRKIDPEPGRCRRTDGKKWRCSKEAYPDSKYCERHMHRGKNRSRKPVEVLKTASLTTTSTSPTPTPTPTITSSEPQSPYLHSPYTNNINSNHLTHYPFAYQNMSSVKHPEIGPFDSAFYSDTNKDYRFVYGMKREVDEHAFFSAEPSSGTMRGFSSSSNDHQSSSWQLTPLTMSCCSSSSSSKQHKRADHQHDCYNGVLERMEEPHEKTVHRFFDEWPPPKDRETWLDLDEKSSNNNAGSVSAIRLSMSIPCTTTSHHPHDFSSLF